LTRQTGKDRKGNNRINTEDYKPRSDVQEQEENVGG
jgi:hypothetical protein